MRVNVLLIIAATLLLMVDLPAISLQYGSAELNEALSRSSDPNELFPVIIVMKEQYDSAQLYQSVKLLPKAERRGQTISVLKRHSETSQASIRKYLNGLKKSDATSIRYLWITNIIGLEASRNTLSALDKRKDIQSIEYDPSINALIDGYESFDKEVSSSVFDEQGREIPYHITITKSDEVWGLGYEGDGVIVAVVDTGVNYNHYDLENRMWEGVGYPNHGYNFVNNTTDPMDDFGHGSHCAGIIAGDGSAGTQSGVAPKARIMALKVLDSMGSGRLENSFAAFQFAVEHGAHILSVSLGWSNLGANMKSMWRNTTDNVLSAGVVAAVAAGNEGPQRSTLRVPGEVPSPWLHPDQSTVGGLSAVITVGASNNLDKIADFSSRGPATWSSVPGYNDYPISPGIGLIKPDIIAPGVDVKSVKYNSKDQYLLMSGTSMATPCAAGILALLLSKSDSLTPEDLAMVVQENAVKMSELKNNTYGAGRIDAFEAVTMLGHYPADQENMISLKPLFRWHNVLGENFSFNLGTDNPPTNIVAGKVLAEKRFQLEENLEYDTVYYWRIDPVIDGELEEGVVWSFKTVPAPHVNFDDGSLEPYDWQFWGTGDTSKVWELTDGEAFSGKYSVKSTNDGNNSASFLFVTLDVLEDGYISFYSKVSSESGYDFLRFYIDSKAVGEWSGELDWRKMTYSVKKGMHIFGWAYMKDAMDSAGQDCAWIDDITFPRHPAPPLRYVPRDLQCSADFDNLYLTWEIDLNTEVNPIQFTLMGYNLFRAIDDGDFEKVNDELLEDLSYTEPLMKEGIYRFYLNAVYRNMGKLVESDASEIISLEILPALPAPTFDPPSGEYAAPLEVKIKVDGFEDALIYYTVDGTEPTPDSFLFEESIEIAETTLIKAKVFKQGHLKGEFASAFYEITSSVESDLVPPSDNYLKVYPNPVSRNNVTRSSTEALSIDYYLKEDVRAVDLSIYNVKGQLIKQFDVVQQKGHWQLSWDLKNNNGFKVSSGIYFVRLLTDSKSLNKRVMIIK